MGLVARAVEAKGIATVAVSVASKMTEGLPAPRNVLVRFRLGQVFGPPGSVALQTAVVRDALEALDRVHQPGAIVELPYRWKRERHDHEAAARAPAP